MAVSFHVMEDQNTKCFAATSPLAQLSGMFLNAYEQRTAKRCVSSSLSSNSWLLSGKAV